MSNALNSVTITDGISQVDLTLCQITKSDKARIVTMSPTNRPGDVIQALGDEGITITVDGDWATGAGVTDARTTVQTWHDNNIAVFYNDGNTFGWFTIKQYEYELRPGIPSNVLIHFKLDLYESIRRSVDDSGGLPIGVVNTATFLSASTPSTFSDQTKGFLTYDTGNPIFWTVSLTSLGQALIGRITFSASSTGADWTRVTDIAGSNASTGFSVWCNPSTSLVQCAWAENQILKYVEGTAASESIPFGTVATISSVGGTGDTNTHPYLHVTSSGTRFVTVTSTGGTFMTYDSTDGVSWTGRPAYSVPFTMGQLDTSTAVPLSMAGDLNRYALMYVSHIVSSGTQPEVFIKRIIFHSQSAGAYGTTCLYGFTGETDYSQTPTNGLTGTANLTAYGSIGGNQVVFAIGDYSQITAGQTIQQNPTQYAPIFDSTIAVVNNPYNLSSPLSSCGFGAFISSDSKLYKITFAELWRSAGPYVDLQLTSDNDLSGGVPIFGHLLRTCSSGASFLTAGLTSSNNNLDLYYVENNQVRRYTFNTGGDEIDTTNIPFGTSFTIPVYSQTPRFTLASAGQRFTLWTEAG